MRKFTFSFNKQDYIWSTFIKVLIKKNPSKYLDRELHTRFVGSPGMMLIITCVRGVQGKFDKNGAVWCVLSVPKLVIINLNINIFLKKIIQQPKFGAIFFSKINPNGHFGTKINTFTIYKGDRGGGVNSPQKPKICKKTEALRFLQQISLTGRKDIACNDVDSDSC